MVKRFNLTDEFLAMTYPDDYYKSVIEPAKLGKGPIPSKTEMLLKSQPFKAVTLPAREALNPGSVGAFRASGPPLASKVVGAGRFALGGPFGIAALAGQGIGMGVDAIARATNTPEEYEAMKEAARAQGGFGYFDDVDISQDAVSPVGTNEQRLDIANQFDLPLDYSATDLQARAKRAMTQPGFSIQLEKNDPNIPDEIEFLDGQKFTATPYDPYSFNVAPTRSLGQIVTEARTNEPLDIEDFLGTSTPRDLGFIGNAPTIKEAVAPIGITDRGRGMAGPAVEMIGGQAVPVGDILGRQMALEKADFFEEPESRFGLGELLSLAGLMTQARPVQAAAMFANRDKIARGIDRAKSGIGSLGSKFARKMRGVNPDGTTRTQSQYEAARAQRQKDRRVERMLERKAAGKSYSQKNLNELTTGGSKPGTYTAKGAGSGGSTSGGKVVCTMMNERYGFGSFRNKIWMKFHESYGPEYQKGYHTIFLPLVKIAKGEGKINTAVRKVLEHMGRHVTADMFKIMKGKKRDTLGRIYRAIFEPTCRIIGKIKSALGRG